MDVICLGELLIDFVCPEPDVSLVEAPRFEKAPGGAPANVAVGLAKLGLETGFIGQVGEDPFGHFLRQTLEEQAVDTTHLYASPQARTTLAFVATRRDGRKDITFYRHPGADTLLRPEQIDPAYLASARMFHFGSVSLSHSPAREATLYAARMAREAREEGFEDIARIFEGIGRIEQEHRDRYRKLLDNLRAQRVFRRAEKVKWRCRNCGFTVEGATAPEQCPVCKHPRAYFEMVAVNY